MKLDKRTMQFEIELAKDLNISEKRGKHCVYALSLRLSEDWECCGDCY